MSVPDFAIMVAVDREHVEEFAISFPTWAKFKPSLVIRPIVFVTDSRDKTDHYHIFGRLIEIIGEDRLTSGGNCTFAQVNQRRPHSSQREKMLAGIVFDGPARVSQLGLKYYLKLDCDTICSAGPDDWIDPNWFLGSPEIIAPKWRYTRPASQLADFRKWSDRYPLSFPFSMPIYSLSVDHSKAFHRRMISYCQFGRTDWTQQMAGLCRLPELAGERLPIPSQDTFLSLCAARAGAKIQFADMKARGWRHVGSNIGRLRKAAAEAMELPQT